MCYIEYLFRGKRVDTGEWVYGDLQQDRDFDQFYICGFNYYISESGEEREPFSYEVELDSIGQFSSMIDKDGRKIFHGDIVTYKYRDSDPIRIGIVKYIDFLGAFLIVGSNYELGSPYYTIELIGNIFDNPELIINNQLEV